MIRILTIILIYRIIKYQCCTVKTTYERVCGMVKKTI